MSPPEIADEVHHHDETLPLFEPEATAQLLEKDGKGLRGAEEEDVGDLGDVDSLVEDIHGADDLQRVVLILQPFDNVLSSILRVFSGQGQRRYAVVPCKGMSRISGVGYRGTESERPGLSGWWQVSLQIGRDDRGAGIVFQGGGEFVQIIVGTSPRDLIVINRIVNCIVLEWCEKSPVHSIQEPQFVGDVPVTKRENILAVHSFGSRRESKEKCRFEMPDHLAVAFRFGMVKLIENDVLKGIGCELLQMFHSAEGLDHSKHRSSLLVWVSSAPDEHPESRIPQNRAKTPHGSLEKGLPVCDEQQGPHACLFEI
jgi:hypothetical protein